MIDPEDREWQRKFGESFLDHDHNSDDESLDDEQIDRLEEEFFEDESNPESPRSAYGRLDEVDDAERREKE
ncbi:MAG: hypothetical protein PF508_19160 [Spirochaeta sp.]|jgi:hypothetical protein|nr:hypothetical protein [Spirochaeta sp.]